MLRFAEESPKGRKALAVLAKAHSAMRRVENGVRDSARPGYEQNAYGTFFRTESFEKVLLLMSEAEALSHLDGAVRYSLAGFLSWAGDFKRAAVEYEGVIQAWPLYVQPARCGLALALGRLGKMTEAKRVVDEHNTALAADPRPGIPMLDLNRLGLQDVG